MFPLKKQLSVSLAILVDSYSMVERVGVDVVAQLGREAKQWRVSVIISRTVDFSKGVIGSQDAVTYTRSRSASANFERSSDDSFWRTSGLKPGRKGMFLNMLL